LENLTWVIDGSRRYASHWTLATTGCGVAVLDVNGKLVAYATATPPPWVKTAGAAEAWALLLTLKESPALPNIITDCLALLHAARAGPTFAARAKNTDARIWKQITECTGGSYKELLNALVWMPSHMSSLDSSCRSKSNGRLVSTAEWRANQLADTLAKRGALVSPLREEADKVIKTAGLALRLSASRLGTVTFAANNHVIEGAKADGTKMSITKRDSTPIPHDRAKKRDDARLHAITTRSSKQLSPSASPQVVAPLVPLTFAQAKRQKRHAEELALKHAEEQHLKQLVTETAARGTAQPLTATERVTALRQRVLAKSAHCSTSSSSG